MVIKLEDAVKQVQAQLPYSSFGFKQVLAETFDKNRFGITPPGVYHTLEGDCLYFSIRGRDFLKDNHRILTRVCSGNDQHGLWSVHSYLKTESDRTIDFSPFYPTLGSKHKQEGLALTASEIHRYHSPSFISLENVIPLHYDSDLKSLLRIGLYSDRGDVVVKFRTPQVSIILDVIGLDVNIGCTIKKGYLALNINEEKITSTKKLVSLKDYFSAGILEADEDNSKQVNAVLQLTGVVDNYIVKFLRKLL